MRVIGSHIWVVPLSRRFTHPDGSFAGEIVTGISIPFFVKYYDTFDIGKRGAILLALVDGTLLVRRPFREADIGRNLGDGDLFRDHLPKNPIGIAEIKSSTDGITRLSS